VRSLVVYVHGLWLNGWESTLLRRRLARQLGCETLAIQYASVGANVDANASTLARSLSRIHAETLHLVGHSMGGLMILELFERYPGGRLARGVRLPPGRIVLLGSPVRGSRAAQNLARLPFGGRLLGPTAAEVLLVPRERRWSGARDLGVIAGDLPVGFGRLVGPYGSPNDGTVLVEETHVVGEKAHLTLHATHSGMVYSSEVARQTASFLRTGRFGS